MITPVVLCGGSGTRLWPLSRTSHPKQLLPLVGEKSLLQETLLRIRHLANKTRPIVVCNQDYRFIVAEQLRDIGVDDALIVLEPEGKNTAPALTIAALIAEQQFGETLLLVLPADHVIQNHVQFAVSVHQASVLAEQGMLTTFGVVPSKPETGYGYIHQGEALADGGYRVSAFVEKPTKAIAEQYLQSGEYYWNSGMFMFSARTYLAEMQQYAPVIVDVCRQCVLHMTHDLDFQRIKSDLFRTCPSDSIDYAVMEKSHNIAVVPLHSDWSDVGSWDAVWNVGKANSVGNVVLGDVLAENVHNSYLHAESRLLAVVGVSDVAVIETADAVLVTHKDSCQDVKLLVNTLRRANRSESERHRREYRPWGYYEILSDGPTFKVKHLVVKSGGKLSLQMHKFRSEHWVVVQGTATVTRGDDQFELEQNQSTFINAMQKHRLENKSDTLLELIEVQTGTYFGEDDIVRFEDVYRRELCEA